jgi:hypothetical protein
MYFLKIIKMKKKRLGSKTIGKKENRDHDDGCQIF